jgi:periplasmic protein TonB
VFGKELHERDSPRLPAPESKRFWATGAIVSVAFHAAVAFVLLFGTMHQGEFATHQRSADLSAMVMKVALLDEPAPALPVSTLALRTPGAGRASPIPSTTTTEPVERPALEERQPAASAGAPSNAVSIAAALPDDSSSDPAAVAALGSDYRRRLLEHIAAHRKMPPAGAQPGQVYVNFALLRSGDVQNLSVAVSSGDPALDRAAIDSIENARPMPAIPPGLPDRLTIMLPIDFRSMESAPVSTRP